MTHSPVPFYNFAVSPQVNSRDELSWRYANNVADTKPDHFEAIHLPNNTVIPLLIGALAMGFGFGLTWRIWWMAGLSLLGMIAVVIYRSFARDAGYVLSGATLTRLESEPSRGVVEESQFLSKEGAR